MPSCFSSKLSNPICDNSAIKISEPDFTGNTLNEKTRYVGGIIRHYRALTIEAKSFESSEAPPIRPPSTSG